MVLRMLLSGQVDLPRAMPRALFPAVLSSLQKKGMVSVVWDGCLVPVSYQLTEVGYWYLVENMPRQRWERWKWLIPFTIAVAGLAMSVVNLCR